MQELLPRNLVAQIVLRLKIPPVGRNDSAVCFVSPSDTSAIPKK